MQHAHQADQLHVIGGAGGRGIQRKLLGTYEDIIKCFVEGVLQKLYTCVCIETERINSAIKPI